MGRAWHCVGRPSRALTVEVIVAGATSLFIALMILLGGEFIERTAPDPALAPIPPWIAGADTGDPDVTNGLVTPWMELASAPSPSLTPCWATDYPCR